MITYCTCTEEVFSLVSNELVWRHTEVAGALKNQETKTFSQQGMHFITSDVFDT